jgi:hypothetical protein
VLSQLLNRLSFGSNLCREAKATDHKMNELQNELDKVTKERDKARDELKMAYDEIVDM